MYNSQEQLSSIIHKFSHLKAIPPKMENSKLTCDVHNEYKYRAYIISSRLIVHKAILLKPTKKKPLPENTIGSYGFIHHPLNHPIQNVSLFNVSRMR